MHWQGNFATLPEDHTDVIFADINQADIDGTRADFNARYVRTAGYQVDDSRRDDILKKVATAQNKFSLLDSRVNKTAITRKRLLIEVDDSV